MRTGYSTPGIMFLSSFGGSVKGSVAFGAMGDGQQQVGKVDGAHDMDKRDILPHPEAHSHRASDCIILSHCVGYAVV